VAGTEYCGYSGGGTINQIGGKNSTPQLCLALNQGSSGAYNLDGGVLILSSLVIGSGSASFNFSGGTLASGAAFSTTLPIMLGAGAGANFDTSNGSVTLAGALTGPGRLTKIGSRVLTLTTANSYSGATLVRGGTLALGNALAIQNSTFDTSGIGLLSFGSLATATFGGLTGSGSLRVSNSASAAVNLQVGLNGGNTTFLGSLIGSGSLSKTGSGALTLAGSNSYTGLTSVNQGAILVNGSLASPVTVNNGGALGGTGSLSSAIVNSGGHLAPGDSPGVLNITGSLSLLSGAKMDYELNTPLDSDEVLMPTGTLALSGQQFSDFNFTPLGGFGPGSYTLIDAGTVNGGLGAVTSGTINGLSASLAIQGNDLVLTVVPEPSSAAMLAVAAAVALWSAKARHRFSKRPPIQAG
jgi:autotransporter-associated beta strand protein